MKTTKKLELLFNLEVAINELQKYLDNETNLYENSEKWYNKHAAAQLCEGMTYTKIAIRRLLDL